MLAANAEQLSSSQPFTFLDCHRRFFWGMFEGDRVVTVDFGVPNVTRKPWGPVERLTEMIATVGNSLAPDVAWLNSPDVARIW